MLIHLESGTCKSGVDQVKLDDMVAASYTTTIAFVNNAADYAKYVAYYDVYKDQYYKYRCPTCGKPFRVLSGVCQHIATDACNQDIKLAFEQLHRCIGGYLRASRL